MTATLLAAGWAAFVLVGDSWWQLAVAAFLAVMFTQVASWATTPGTGRSPAPGGSVISSAFCSAIWASGSATAGGSTNTTVITPTPTRRARIRTSRCACWPSPRPGARQPGPVPDGVPHQAYLFFPLLLGEAFSLHVGEHPRAGQPGSRGRPRRRRCSPSTWPGTWPAVFLVLSPLRAVVFILVQQGLFGVYLGARSRPTTRACRSWTRPTNRLPAPPGAHLAQCPRRLAHRPRPGGLNYQIEHHLFPSMPRPNPAPLPAADQGILQQRGSAVRQASLAGSYAQALRHLAVTGRLTPPATVPTGSLP